MKRKKTAVSLGSYLKKEKRWFAAPDFLLVSGLGLGMIPLFPGFWGSLLGLACALGVSHISWSLPNSGGNLLSFSNGTLLSLLPHLLALLFLTPLAIYRSGVVAKKLNVPDHPNIVVDEVVGMWIALLFLFDLGWTPTRMALALLLFRILDMTKPGPIGWLDRWTKHQALNTFPPGESKKTTLARNLPVLATGFGVVADDILAGVITGILVRGLGW